MELKYRRDPSCSSGEYSEDKIEDRLTAFFAAALVLRDQYLQCSKAMFVNRRCQQFRYFGQRQMAVPERNLPGHRHSNAQEEVALAIFTFAGLEKPGKIGRLTLVCRGFEVAQQIEPGAFGADGFF